MADEKKEKKTGRHGSGKRPNRTEVYFTNEEWEKVKSLMAAAGEKSLPVFLRELALHEGTVVAALTVGEKKSITDLGKIGTNIWQIRKDLINYGLDEKAVADIEAMYVEFAKIKEYFNAIKCRNDSEHHTFHR